MQNEPREQEAVVVWDDEDGNYFAQGHIDPEAFRQACVRYDLEAGFSEEEIEEDYSGRIAIEHVKHEWWRLAFPGTDNDEIMVECGPDDEGAQAFTCWRE